MKTLITELVAFILVFAPLSVKAAPLPIDTVGLPYSQIKQLDTLQAFKTAPVHTLELAGFPVAAPNTYPNTYEYGNCTAYVAGRKKVPETFGNANTWAGRAAGMGITVSDTPVRGAIAQTSDGYYGHVAIVLAVEGGRVLITEANVLGLGVVDESWQPISTFRYIYL